MLVQQLLNGAIVGSVYALLALGFTLAFAVLGILNIAHAAVFIWGAFVGLYAVTSGLPLAVAFILGTVAVAVLDYFLLVTLFGRQVRALTESERTAVLLGLNPTAIYVARF